MTVGESETNYNKKLTGWLRGMLDIIIGHYMPRNRVYCGNCTIGIFKYTNEAWALHSWINLT